MEKHETFDVSLTFLRIVIGIVYIWFGVLKIFDVSPVAQLTQDTYTFIPYEIFRYVLGGWETLIGIFFVTNFKFRFAIFFLWMQLLGVFGSVFLNPSIFFSHNPFLLTLEGEFMAKNFILLAASFVLLKGIQLRD